MNSLIRKQAEEFLESTKHLSEEEQRNQFYSLTEDLRIAVRRIEIDKYFVPENEPPNSIEYLSVNGEYKLIVSTFVTKPGSWNYTQGKVFKTGSHNPIAVINRNYHKFLFSWMLEHANGHDYLITGEDYQCQTIIELDTGKRADNYNSTFCWTGIHPSIEGKLLAVSGCFWGAPYDIKVFDFSNPLHIPWKEYDLGYGDLKFVEWFDNNSIKFERTRYLVPEFHKNEEELTEEEDEIVQEKIKNGEKGVIIKETDEFIWSKPVDD